MLCGGVRTLERFETTQSNEGKNSIMKRAFIRLFLTLIVSLLCICNGAFGYSSKVIPVIQEKIDTPGAVSLSDIEKYRGIPFVLLNDNMPSFSVKDLVTTPYVKFSKLDRLGRTGAGMACLGKETLPSEARGQIGDIRPSGWHTVRYDDLIEDRFLYNRCHVLAYQLTGDNATPENLFTGTRYLNIDTMLFFENKVADYLAELETNHVIYRVTPVYDGNNLVASGVQMEAFSVEDQGKGVCFNAFVYNVQPGVLINYADGGSQRDAGYDPESVVSATAAYSRQAGPEILTLESYTGPEDSTLTRSIPEDISETAAENTVNYILNKNTKKFHYPSCSSVSDMKEKNKEYFSGTREEAISRGYKPCKRCNP